MICLTQQKRILTTGAITLAVLSLCGCGKFFQPPTNNPPPSGATLTLWTNSVEYTKSGVYISTQGVASQPVAGSYYYNDGNTPSGGSNSFGANANGSFNPLYTGNTGYLSVNGLNLNSAWKIYWNWTPVGCTTSFLNQPTLFNGTMYQNTYDLTPNETLPISCPYAVGDAHPQLSQQFFLAGQTPPTLTEVASVPLSTTNGAPQLLILNGTNQLVSTMSATSIAADGVTATFPFPVDSSGNALPSDLYSTNIVNLNSDGSTSYAGGLGSVFSIAVQRAGFTGAFGVAAVNQSTAYEDCYTQTSPQRRTTCSGSTTQSSYPVTTLPGQNSVVIGFGSTKVTVGANPTAIVTFGSGSYSHTVSSGNPVVTSKISGTKYALVTNTGSNSVSIVDVQANVVSSTINVGGAPVAAVVTPDASVAYVANYGDSTVSRIDLSSLAVTTTQPVGSSPTSIDLDANGNVWVGGAGYLSEFDPSSLAPVSTVSQSGNVVALAISKQQNSAVTTVVANNTGQASGNINYNSANASTGSQSLQGGSASPMYASSAQAYSTSGSSTAGTTPGQLANGILVSANYGNVLSVALTSTGFTVQDISGGGTLLSGSLPTLGRGLAVDPDYGYVYITLPDSNSVVTIPLPNEPSN